MATLTSSLIVKLIDGVSGPARKAANALLGIGQAARGINGARSGSAMVATGSESEVAVTSLEYAAICRMLTRGM